MLSLTELKTKMGKKKVAKGSEEDIVIPKDTE